MISEQEVITVENSIFIFLYLILFSNGGILWWCSKLWKFAYFCPKIVSIFMPRGWTAIRARQQMHHLYGNPAQAKRLTCKDNIYSYTNIRAGNKILISHKCTLEGLKYKTQLSTVKSKQNTFKLYSTKSSNSQKDKSISLKLRLGFNSRLPYLDEMNQHEQVQ